MVWKSCGGGGLELLHTAYMVGHINGKVGYAADKNKAIGGGQRLLELALGRGDTSNPKQVFCTRRKF